MPAEPKIGGSSRLILVKKKKFCPGNTSVYTEGIPVTFLISKIGGS